MNPTLVQSQAVVHSRQRLGMGMGHSARARAQMDLRGYRVVMKVMPTRLPEFPAGPSKMAIALGRCSAVALTRPPTAMSCQGTITRSVQAVRLCIDFYPLFFLQILA